MTGDEPLMSLDEYEVHKLKKESILTKPKPQFSCFFEQEIYEQVEAVSRVLNYGSRIDATKPGPIVKLGGLDNHITELKSVENLVLAACGTSSFAAEYGAILF